MITVAQVPGRDRVSRIEKDRSKTLEISKSSSLWKE